MKEAEKVEKEAFTAWGKEINGLQAGLGSRAGQKRAYRHGETVTLVIWVRNVGKEAVKFEYLKQFFIDEPPSVTDGKGKAVRLFGSFEAGGQFHKPVEVNLAPGKETELYELNLNLQPEDTVGGFQRQTLFLGRGSLAFSTSGLLHTLLSGADHA